MAEMAEMASAMVALWEDIDRSMRSANQLALSPSVLMSVLLDLAAAINVDGFKYRSHHVLVPPAS